MMRMTMRVFKIYTTVGVCVCVCGRGVVIGSGFDVKLWTLKRHGAIMSVVWVVFQYHCLFATMSETIEVLGISKFSDTDRAVIFSCWKVAIFVRGSFR